MDFSQAGYGGGGVRLPVAPVAVTLAPSGGDDTPAIQAAIDRVSAMPPDARGFRGAVLLHPGHYNISSTLTIAASGVVLRGSGSGASGTVLTMTGPPFLFLRMAGTGSFQSVGPTATMTDAYVPSGATSFHVNDASAFVPGQTVLVRRPVTAAWVHLMKMDSLFRSGAHQTCIAPGSSITTDRVIAAVNGNEITLDVPLTDSFDSQYVNPPGGTVRQYTFPGRISQVGAEHFTVIAHPVNVDISEPQYTGLSVSAVIDAWAEDIVFQDTQNTVTISTNVKRMTLDGVHVKHTVQHTGDGPADFALSGTQLLAQDCSVTGRGNTWAAVTQSRVTGPVVLLNFFADDRGFDPHQRWATGLLCDQCSFPNSRTSDKAGIAYSNRGILGSGHGWDAGWAVAWNVTAATFTVQQPPGAQNFCIGCIGTILTQAQPGGDGTLLPNGIYDSYGTPVAPASLYLAQLCERLGPSAGANIGYPAACIPGVQHSAPVAAEPGVFLRQRIVTGEGPQAVARLSSAEPAGAQSPSLVEAVRQYGVRGLSFGVTAAAASSPTVIRVYTMSGRPVRVLVNERLEPGVYEVAWDGADDRGRSAAPGVYLAVLTIGPYRATQHLILRQE
jgi:hypothetical protein